MVRLAVIGVGRVGGEVAYLAAALRIADELVLYDAAGPLLNAQVLDLLDAGLDVAISTERDAIRTADICVFSAGFPRNPSVKTRADLLFANLPAVKETAKMLASFDGVLVTITNPMDVNNYYFHKVAGIPRERCIGFGGQLDSARYALALRQRGITGFPYVLGEHGEHQVPVFSTLSKPVPVPDREEILAELRMASMEIIRGKGGTVFGPAMHIVDLIRNIAEDSRGLVACSSVLSGEYGLSGCSVGVPARIGRGGITKVEEWQLDGWENEKMNEAGTFIAGLCRTVDP